MGGSTEFRAGSDEADANVSTDEPPMVRLTANEWESLGDVAMSLYGILALIDSRGFDDSTGAHELLRLTYQRYERILARIRTAQDALPDATTERGLGEDPDV